jgi:DmsE family decaheme c-type cytochrome
MRRRGVLPLASAALSVYLLSQGGAASAQAPSPTPAPAPKATAEAPPTCLDCHGDIVKAFASNPHARYSHKDKKPNPTDVCETCHGNGAKHMEAGGDASLIHSLKGLAGAQDCLNCHQNAAGEHGSFSTGFHSNTETVNCLSCHSIHQPTPKSEHLLAKMPGPLCQTCHLSESASFRNKPYVHRLDRGGMTCLDCHSPHNRKGQPLKLTVQGELPCLNCHAELRGPFIFDHVTGSGGTCLSCHQPHGSNNPNMLLWAQVSQLCLSCHSQTGGPPTLGPQPPSFHNISLPRYRNCTTCHTAVHGSNLSPQLLK